VKKIPVTLSRRHFLKLISLLGAASLVPVPLLAAGRQQPVSRVIPKTGERIPAIGMGSWLTFAVGGEPDEIMTRTNVLQAFFDKGGAMIDSSPMYGSSEEVIGECLANIQNKQNLFSATKVWTHGWQQGIRQMRRSRAKWGIEVFDLMQIHNLLDWETHLATLRAWKKEGKIRYIGITTSHGRRHDEMEHIMKTQDAIDFVQFTYNIEDREAEQRLLPLARERGLAVIINRPFQRAGLFENVEGKPLPGWAKDIDCQYWAQFFLKFVISHPAVTCAIPATSRVDHMQENMGAMYGPLPDESMREKMIRYYTSIT
jgi:diketogulonate reductase-like aldo/keto reductase